MSIAPHPEPATSLETVKADASPEAPLAPFDAAALRRIASAQGARAGNLVPEPQVTAMFDDIAPVYDRINTLLTLGADTHWRRAAVAATRLPAGGSVVDVASGTGKLSAQLADRVGPFGRVVAIDLSPGMIGRATAAYRDLVQLEFRVGNALELPAADGEFDAATIAFGLRNLSSWEAGFRELRRVVRPGGRVVCLELTVPRRRIWRTVFMAAFRTGVPLAGRVFRRAAAYRYLPASLDGFPDAETLAATMLRAGLVDITIRRLGFGSVALHTGTVPG
jgi:demethylmenaquinone methyltransferase / 2-methoxy-6-polyprenyl-1,4-benzoquinol methylase